MNSKIPQETIKRVLSDDQNVSAAAAANQQEFPFERDEEAQVTRREFCNFLAITSSALFLSVAAFGAKSIAESNSDEDFPSQLIEGGSTIRAGEALNFRYPTASDTAILVRTQDENLYAYGQKCTHLACPVFFEEKKEQLECPCHEGGFDIRTGEVLYGPPPRALDQIVLEKGNDGEIYAVGRIPGGLEHA